MHTAATDFRRTALSALIERTVTATPALDIHTHLYDPAFGGLLLWGIDELLIYHYLAAETLRYLDVPCEQFWALNKTQQADCVWQTLFLEHSPVSEACRGVLTTLHRFGLDVHPRDLPALRKWFAQWPLDAHLERCLQLANLKTVCMTNSPFDDAERLVWQQDFARDERFRAALRIDPLLVNWPEAAVRLAAWGYNVGEGLSAHTLSEVRRFLADWTRRIHAGYLLSPCRRSSVSRPAPTAPNSSNTRCCPTAATWAGPWRSCSAPAAPSIPACASPATVWAGAISPRWPTCVTASRKTNSSSPCWRVKTSTNSASSPASSAISTSSAVGGLPTCRTKSRR